MRFAMTIIEPIQNFSNHKLEHLLAQGQWRDADQETARLLHQVAGRSAEGFLRVEDVQQLPMEVLSLIDILWTHYSNAHFGFRVQKRIWIESGGRVTLQKPTSNDYEAYQRFGSAVGWRISDTWLSYEQLLFSVAAPEGHLPGVGCWSGRIALLSRPDL